MSEAYAWPEGSLHLWTGSHTASGNPIAYATDSRVTLTYRWDWTPTLSGNYNPHLAGKQANIGIGGVYAYGANIVRLFQAQTAVHMKFTHQHFSGSAGFVLWSARLDNLTENGANGQTFGYSLAGQSYTWSAF